jgi:D-alanyl-D-alanine carboxypeptidase/D-alanyl-D-alanine-endopeptidase (penicillin-binding protein 4)
VELHRFHGKALAEIVRLFVKYSNNAIAEGLVKAMGAAAGGPPASWHSGLAVMRQELEGLGIPVETLVLADGSGLSYENRVPPRGFVEALLLASRSFRFGPELIGALPIAAADGTLAKRAEGAAFGVRAKTGLLTRVTGLSGYAERPDGRVVVFSVLTNGWRGSAEAAMNGVDAFITELVEGGPELADDEPDLGG